MLYSNDVVKHIERLEIDYLAFSYLYYYKNETVVPDSFYDNLCVWLMKRIKTKEAKKTRFYDLCKDIDVSGSGFTIKEEDYPQYIKNIAFKLQMQKLHKRELQIQEVVRMKHKDMFKIIVAGSRTFKDYDMLQKKLDKLLRNKRDKIIVIISGMARGADSFGVKYAKKRDYWWAEYPADWDNFGDSAGYRRNVEMSENADACIVFMEKEGTNGSQHMIDIAEEKGLQLRVVLF